MDESTLCRVNSEDRESLVFKARLGWIVWRPEVINKISQHINRPVQHFRDGLDGDAGKCHIYQLLGSAFK